MYQHVTSLHLKDLLIDFYSSTRVYISHKENANEGLREKTIIFNIPNLLIIAVLKIQYSKI